jgi:hypothetical protein
MLIQRGPRIVLTTTSRIPLMKAVKGTTSIVDGTTSPLTLVSVEVPKHCAV